MGKRDVLSQGNAEAHLFFGKFIFSFSFYGIIKNIYLIEILKSNDTGGLLCPERI